MFFQRERNGATLKPKGVDVVFRLDTAVVVIDGTRGLPGAPRGTPLDSMTKNVGVLKVFET
jgi:hypothetical protein